MAFYDEDWRELRRKFPLIAKKIEDVLCGSVSFEEHAEHDARLKRLERQVAVLVKMNGMLVKARDGRGEK